MDAVTKKKCACAGARLSLLCTDGGGKPLAGVCLTLCSNGCPLFSLISGGDGLLRLPAMSRGDYSLSLCRPQGLTPLIPLPRLRVTQAGNLRINGKTRRKITLSFYSKANETKQ
jgi:hypothetical protein